MRRLRQQDGFSIIPAIGVLAFLIVLGGVAVQEAISALSHSREQESIKRTLTAADAAIDAAVYALNRADVSGSINIDPLHPDQINNQTCLAGTGETAVGSVIPMPAGTLPDPSGRRWCPETQAESAHDSATLTDTGATVWTYRVSELARVGAEGCAGSGVLSLDREIVAVAKSPTSVRRVRARLRASVSLLSGAAVQSGSSDAPLTMRDTARVLGNATSNNDINGAVTNTIAGSGIPGPGHAVTGVTPAGTRTAACSKFVLPTVDPGTSATTNDNTLRNDSCVTALQVTTPCTTTVTVSVGFPPVLTTTTTTTGGVTYDATNKTLRVWGNGRTVLNGATYSFCSIRLEGSGTLLVKSSTPITRIFLRDPADCAGVTNAGQIVMDGTSTIVNCHGQTQPETLQLYALGATTQTFAGAGTLTAGLMLTACGTGLSLTGVPMVVYAPKSRVELGGTTAFAGQVVGDTVAMSGAAAVQPVNALVNLNQLGAKPVLPLYQPVDYVECTGRTFDELPPENPAQGC